MKSYIISAAALLLASTAADAARFDLSYALPSGSVISAVLDGDLSNGLFTVNGVNSFAVNGAVVPDSYFSHSVDALSLSGDFATPGAFAIDGSYFDLYIWNDNLDNLSAFAIAVGDATSAGLNSSAVLVSSDLEPSQQAFFGVFDPASYSGHLEDAQPSPAPEPASWAMVLGGFAAIGSAMRARRRTIVTFA